ncbi:Ferritin-like domain-containing protein [Nitrosospira multiformis]|uniref:Ferritin-like domain-containing protein n=1 Tax=Nitrosospira multiformis TaxID=1231 RepID=A0A1H9YTJ6_9PROT|nr:ferritin-like domain-containing protein [Nitrosospira multiformis]SES72412.1 Ferritin-like domain-containing protein [Nitrosospira multiformis]
MEKTTVLGKNRTGIDMSPIDAKEMMALAKITPSSSTGDEQAIAEMRSQYIREAEVIGSIPPPGTLKGMASTAMEKLTGKNPEVFIDKLGCRLAFERAGVRLYDALITKCAASSNGSIVPIERLREFRNEELEHFKLVERAIRSIGADPTAQTPSADVDGMASIGLVQVLTDPRTSVAHCLEAILIAELADNDAWQLLIMLTEKMGMDDMARDFQNALREEDEHLAHIRQWFKQMVMEDAAVVT